MDAKSPGRRQKQAAQRGFGRHTDTIRGDRDHEGGTAPLGGDRRCESISVTALAASAGAAVLSQRRAHEDTTGHRRDDTTGHRFTAQEGQRGTLTLHSDRLQNLAVKAELFSLSPRLLG